MEVQKEAFGNLIEFYKVLPIDTKRKEIISEIEELISSYSKISTELGVMPNMTLNKEILNMDRSNLSEDEYLNAIYSYLNVLSEISAQFIEKMNGILENQSFN